MNLTALCRFFARSYISIVNELRKNIRFLTKNLTFRGVVDGIRQSNFFNLAMLIQFLLEAQLVLVRCLVLQKWGLKWLCSPQNPILH